MSSPLDNQPTPPNDADATEARMRQALGLRKSAPTGTVQQQPDQARQRHRFVQDGEVPVVMLHGRREPEAAGGRLAAAESALQLERAARATAERALEEAQSLVQSLKTKLAHAEIAHAEALAAERAGRDQALALLAEARAGEAAARALAAPAKAAVEPVETDIEAAPPRRRGRPRGAARVAAEAAPELALEAVFEAAPVAEMPERRKPAAKGAKLAKVAKAEKSSAAAEDAEEQEPVQWWLPSYRAQKRAK